jgi:hypothetical protein
VRRTPAAVAAKQWLALWRGASREEDAFLGSAVRGISRGGLDQEELDAY